MAVEPVVRHAKATDLGALREIDVSSRSILIDQRGGEAWLAEHPPLTEMVDAELVSRSLVGVIDDVIVGFVVWAIEDDPQRGRVIRVERVHVVADARELGFGDALLGAVIDVGRARDCRYVEAVALPGDRETKNLYERAGITARSITVSKRLDV
jgi:GNAT superfamily N-acetyltransferase